MCTVRSQKGFLRCAGNKNTKDYDEDNGVRRRASVLQEIRKIWIAWWGKEKSIKNRK